jgi:hypothetical protein
VVLYTGIEGIQLFSEFDRTTLQKVLRAAQSGVTGQSPEWMEAIKSLKKATGNDQGLYERLVGALRKAGDRNIPPGSAGAQVEAPGVGKVAGEEAFDPKQPMEIRKGPGSGEYKKPKIIADLEKLPNAKLFASGQLEHVLFGNQNKAGRFTGWHHFSSRRPGERVRLANDLSMDQLERDSHGVYKATVEASFDGGKTWVQKTASDHTFFPDGWSKEKVVDEIASAFKEGRDRVSLPGYDFSGRSQSGVYIAGYLDNSGNIVSAFPIFGK